MTILSRTGPTPASRLTAILSRDRALGLSPSPPGDHAHAGPSRRADSGARLPVWRPKAAQPFAVGPRAGCSGIWLWEGRESTCDDRFATHLRALYAPTGPRPAD